MKNNMSSTDRIVRAVVAVLFGVLIFSNAVSGVLAIILGVIAVIFLVTALLGFCPLYTLFGWSTKKGK
jgi:small-conductance mechanosensitive channel